MGRDRHPRKDADQPSDGDARRDDVYWPGKELLGGASAKEVLARLIDGDPLELGARSLERVRANALLVSPQRLHLRAVARVAHASQTYRGKPELAQFLIERIDVSIRELVQEDREEERSGMPTDEPWDPRYAFVSEVLGVEPLLARRACVAFNSLELELRRVYFAVAVEGKSVNRLAAEGNGPPQKIRAQLKAVLNAIAAALDTPLGGAGGGITDDGR